MPSLFDDVVPFDPGRRSDGGFAQVKYLTERINRNGSDSLQRLPPLAVVVIHLDRYDWNARAQNPTAGHLAIGITSAARIVAESVGRHDAQR